MYKLKKKVKKVGRPKRVEPEVEFEEVEVDGEEETEEQGEEVGEEIEEEPETASVKPKLPKIPHTWTVQDVPTQSERVIYNQKTGKAYDIHSALALILNKLDD